jgi:hypothetical protein
MSQPTLFMWPVNTDTFPLRIVPKGEFAYETECLSRQRMWEVVAQLANEVRVAKAVLLYLSGDYFDSFWTCLELLAIQFYRMRPDQGIRDGYTADPLTGALHPLTFEAGDLPVAILTPQQRERFNHLRKNHDPGSVAPEGRRPRAGLFDQLIGWVVQQIGFYDPEFSSSSWWRNMLVPCPNCRPHRRSAIDVNWNQHLAIEAYGYFACSSDQLRVDEPMCCPRCRQAFFLTQVKPPRTLWIPGLTGRAWPQDMAVIEYEPVWEVVTERQRNNPQHPQGFKASS